MAVRKYSDLVIIVNTSQRGVFFMSLIPKEAVKEIIKNNKFQNPGEVLAFLEEAFKDVLQEMLETKMNVSLIVLCYVNKGREILCTPPH